MSWHALSFSGILLALAGPLSAQSPGTFEVGGFGRAAWFDDTLDLDDAVGGGGLIGIYIVRNLALEAEASYVSTNDSLGQDISNTPLRGRLTWHIPLGGYASAIRLGAGYVRNLYRQDVSFDDDGLAGLVGVRVGVSERFALQVDGTVDYVPSPDEDRADDYMNWGLQAGVALLFGNRYDRDKDKIDDKNDRCPATPAGELVDTTGCSASQRDADTDKVMDNADRCANTPRGEQVDAQGCAPSQKDTDRDAMIDGRDRCLGTPAGESVDQAGCGASQRDGDADRVADLTDRCPGTSAGEQVDTDGCAASQRDRDGDRVADNTDACADTPTGTAVDSRGCPRDSDADGVFEDADQCPDTPNRRVVDQHGCPLRGVTFTLGKTTLTKDSKAILQDAAQSLVAAPDRRVEVAGHADSTGSHAFNLRLSQRRAQVVEKFLQEHGVPSTQLTTQGYGPDQPIASNETAQGRAQNRRVEFNRVD